MGGYWPTLLVFFFKCGLILALICFWVFAMGFAAANWPGHVDRRRDW